MHCLLDGAEMSMEQVYKRKSPLDPNGIMFECPTCGIQVLVWQYANGHVQLTLAKLPKEGRQTLTEKFMEVFEQESVGAEDSL